MGLLQMYIFNSFWEQLYRLRCMTVIILTDNCDMTHDLTSATNVAKSKKTGVTMFQYEVVDVDKCPNMYNNVCDHVLVRGG